MTSAPMSPSAIAQKGPASTRVRSMTRRPSRGGLGDAAGARRALVLLVRATGSSFPQALDQGPADDGGLLAAGPGAPPEEAGPVGDAEGREVEDRVQLLDRDG